MTDDTPTPQDDAAEDREPAEGTDELPQATPPGTTGDEAEPSDGDGEQALAPEPPAPPSPEELLAKSGLKKSKTKGLDFSGQADELSHELNVVALAVMGLRQRVLDHNTGPAPGNDVRDKSMALALSLEHLFNLGSLYGMAAFHSCGGANPVAANQHSERNDDDQ